MTISMDKQYRTRDGHAVRIYAVDGKCPSERVHGAIQYIDGGWVQHSWDIKGNFGLGKTDLDLIEVKPRIQREYWVNVYQKNYINPVLWETLDDAKQSVPYGFEPIARVKVVIDCEEGEGL